MSDLIQLFQKLRSDVDSLLTSETAISGWQKHGYTWVYVSATQFKIIGVDVTAHFPVGMKIRLKQGAGYLYFYVVSAAFGSDTTVTVTGGSDYNLANANITDNYYSYAAEVQGFPQWFNYAATVSGTGGTAGSYAESTNIQRFQVVGRSCNVVIEKQITNLGSWSGTVQVLAPITPNLANYERSPSGFIYAFAAAANSPKGCMPSFNTTNGFYFDKTIGATNVQWSDMATNDFIFINYLYKI